MIATTFFRASWLLQLMSVHDTLKVPSCTSTEIEERISRPAMVINNSPASVAVEDVLCSMCGDSAGMDTPPGKSAPSTYPAIPHQYVPFSNGRWRDWCKPINPLKISQVGPIVLLHAACNVHADAALRAANTMATYKSLARAGPRRSIVRLAASALMSRQAHHATEAAVVMGRGVGSLDRLHVNKR
jgi:hypothetical protein